MTPLIEAKNISVRLGGRVVLKHTDLAVYPNKILTIIGPNGGGKTTLVKTLLGLIRPSSGQVFRQADLVVGYVPQKLLIDASLPLSVSRFMTLHGRYSSEQILAALARTRVEHLIDRSVHVLSGGEWQRVLLARAILRSPQLLVLDEPVQGVDFNGEAEFYALIGEIREQTGCGVVLVSHDLHVVMGATDEVVCLNGHVCCHGRPESVTQHEEYLALFGKKHAEAYAVYTHHHDHHHGVDGHVESGGCQHE